MRFRVLGFLLMATVAICSAPGISSAQQSVKVWRIGFIANVPPASSPEAARLYEAFQQELRDRGYLEGKNLATEFRFAGGRIERFPDLAAELVRLKVDVIVAGGGGAGARAAKDASATIPIVMLGASDPVGAGLVASLARPGGNVTGIADYQLDLLPKRLELLKTAAPRALRVVNLHGQYGGFSPSTLDALNAEWARATQALGVVLSDVEMRAPQDFQNATAAIVRERPDALLLGPNPTTFFARKELAEFAIKHRLPAIGGPREMATAGALMSHGSDTFDTFRKVAIFVDETLKGAKPADLPVEQPTKFELVINLKTAKALGLTIPQSLLQRADEVIQE